MKKSAIGVLRVAVAIALMLVALSMFFGALTLFLGGPDPSPSRTGEARIYGVRFSLFGLALFAGGITAGKFGISLARAKQEPAKTGP